MCGFIFQASVDTEEVFSAHLVYVLQNWYMEILPSWQVVPILVEVTQDSTYKFAANVCPSTNTSNLYKAYLHNLLSTP